MVLVQPAHVERRGYGHRRAQGGEPLGKLQAGRADVDRAVYVRADDIEQLSAPDLRHAGEDRHGEPGGRTMVARQQRLIVRG